MTMYRIIADGTEVDLVFLTMTDACIWAIQNISWMDWSIKPVNKLH